MKLYLINEKHLVACDDLRELDDIIDYQIKDAELKEKLTITLVKDLIVDGRTIDITNIYKG